jgi:hypothetical protein
MVAKQQQVLNYLLSSLSHEMLLQVVCDTPIEVWSYVSSNFESQSRACVINVRMALSTTKKGDMPISKYITKMKALADEMASVGKRLDDEELVSYILVGLDSDFDGVISTVSATVEPITMAEFYGQLPSHEQCWNLIKPTSIMLPMLQLLAAVVVLGEVVAEAGVVVTSVMATMVRSIIQILAVTCSANCVARRVMWSRSASRDLIAHSLVKKRWHPWPLLPVE